MPRLARPTARPRVALGTCAALGFVGVVAPAPPVAGEVVITEIMYNPESHEGYQPDPVAEPDREAIPNNVEWVELYNPGKEAVNVGGWRLVDEDGETGPMPAAASIPPGGALVVIPVEMDVADFHAAWGRDIALVQVTGWGPDGLYNLANSPSATNENLRLVDADGETVDRVNYDDSAPWPSDSPQGPSIYLIPDALDAASNDEGSYWLRSTEDLHGARAAKATDEFRAGDIGSPGHVPTID